MVAASAAFCAIAPPASAQTVAEPFDDAYSVRDIGSPPGVPASLGGLTLKAGTTDRLLIGGAANGASGALYEIGVTRDAQGHITGFVEQEATRYADAAYNDGGVTYGPGGVLFLARWPTNELGQTKPGAPSPTRSSRSDRRVDDRYFVATSPSSSIQDPQSAPPAWLIDSVAGQRGALTWQDQPTTIDDAEQELVLFPVPHLTRDNGYPDPRSLPRVVDKRNWTIRPFRVPEDASPALAIHQPGSGRIWIGTSPASSDVGLAYTDDGGASWTNVQTSRRCASPARSYQALPQPGTPARSLYAATGDHVRGDGKVGLGPWGAFGVRRRRRELGRRRAGTILRRRGGLFVLSDDRLLLVSSRELGAGSGRPGVIVSKTLRVSSSASDWSQPGEIDRRSFGSNRDIRCGGPGEPTAGRARLVRHRRAESDPEVFQHRSQRPLEHPGLVVDSLIRPPNRATPVCPLFWA